VMNEIHVFHSIDLINTIFLMSETNVIVMPVNVSVVMPVVMPVVMSVVVPVDVPVNVSVVVSVVVSVYLNF
jgi:hypothetical protein